MLVCVLNNNNNKNREDKRTTRPDTYIHTNIHRDVGRTSPSMWGSLRLAPIIGASLSEPHTGRKRPPRYLCIYVCMYAYVIP